MPSADEDRSGPPTGAQIDIHIDEGVADGVYSNAASVHYGEHELVMDFIYLHPLRDRGSLKARVIVNPDQARALVRTLQGALAAHAQTFDAPPVERAKMTRDDAIAIATRHIEGAVTVDPSSTLHVDTTDSHYIVEWRTALDPHTRGPDYDAHVEIDRATGEVTTFLVGS